MAVLKKIPLPATLIFIVILLALNIFYYAHSRDMLIRSEQEKMVLLYNSVLTDLEKEAAGEKFVEDLIGRNLRTAAIAAKFKLGADIDRVQNSELTELSELLGIDHITLFKQVSDDFVGARSSDAKDLNVSAKGWDTIYVAFKQLFEKHNVDVAIGQKLPHYWSGPIDTSSTDPSTINKWGYYYDGTTNYLINPYVHDSSFRQYQELTGVGDAIRRLMKQNEHMSLEISVLNTDKLLGRTVPSVNPTPSSWFSERLVLYGQYDYRDGEETRYALQAVMTGQPVYYKAKVGDKTFLKSYTPVRTDVTKYNAFSSPPLIAIASDYTVTEQTLNRQLLQTVLFMVICTSCCLLIAGVILIVFNRSKHQAVQEVQDTYTDNVETLFQSIREQRHDFINHIQMIHAFVAMNKFEDLRQYTNSLVGEIRIVNDLVGINHPALIALIQAKLSQAEQLGITFEHQFRQMDKLKVSPVKATDIVKLLCNLIDNAFDASLELPEEERKLVRVAGGIQEDTIRFVVANKGNPIAPELVDRLFQAGFTSKLGGKNSGLGLHIVRQLAHKYGGDVEVQCKDGLTEFQITIPLKLA